ncbi:MAG: hypothetical protein M1826_006743 [Phylliscum demangeonii]|nr:MAG: hypothetical protein M1826_006743 [Phylliscum demangeonii]
MANKPELSQQRSPTRSVSSSRERLSSADLSQIYHEASTFFLTRRFREAYDALDSLIQPASARGGGDLGLARVAVASRHLRVKIWSLYITLLDAIANLSPEEGRAEFGRPRWRRLLDKVSSGSVWGEVVRQGYHGVEEALDGEVVINLSTLLLTHAASQVANQRRLETYLSAARREAQAEDNGGARKAKSTVTIVEIYAIHVLSRTEEWHRAREFISASDILDDDRRRSLLQIIQLLEAEKKRGPRQSNGQRESPSTVKEPAYLDTLAEEGSLTRHQNGLETNQGVARKESRQGLADPKELVNGHVLLPPEPSSSLSQHAAGPTRRTRPAQSSRLQSSEPSSPIPPIFVSQTTHIIKSLQRFVLSFTQTIKSNPLTLFRTILFIFALLLTFRSGVYQDRLRRMTATGWRKIKGTIGMGLKMSYV